MVKNKDLKAVFRKPLNLVDYIKKLYQPGATMPKQSGVSKSEEAGPIGETKSEKFERIAQRRVTELVAKIRLIGNLSDKRNYDYTEDHVRQIFDALESEVRACKGKFRAVESSTPPSFSFKR